MRGKFKKQKNNCLVYCLPYWDIWVMVLQCLLILFTLFSVSSFLSFSLTQSLPLMGFNFWCRWRRWGGVAWFGPDRRLLPLVAHSFLVVQFCTLCFFHPSIFFSLLSVAMWFIVRRFELSEVCVRIHTARWWNSCQWIYKVEWLWNRWFGLACHARFSTNRRTMTFWATDIILNDIFIFLF